MTCAVQERFKYNFESSATASYLIIEADAAEKIEQYQIEMIVNNPSTGILPMDVRYKDEIIKFYYNITSKLVLSQFFKRKKLTRNEFITILNHIVSTVLDAKSYFLYEKCFVLDEDHIFINPGTLEVSLVYLPIRFEGELLSDFRGFLMKLIMETANIDENSSDNFLQRIIGYLKEESYTLIEFKKLLDDLKNNRSFTKLHSPSPMHSVQTPGQDQSELPVYKKMQIEDKVRRYTRVPASSIDQSNSNEEIVSIKSLSIPKQEMGPIPEGKKPAGGLKEPSVQSDTVMKYKTSTILMGCLSQVIILILIFLCSDVLKSLGDDLVTTYIGVSIAVLAGDYFLFKKLFDKKNRIPVTNTATSDQEVNIFGEIKAADFAKREIRNIYHRQERQADHFLTESNDEIIETPSIPLEGLNIEETSFLGLAQEKTPCLRSMKDGMIEDISINKESFYLGRMKGEVDYAIENHTVSKVHAELISREDGIYLKDLNSKNGTYVNGERIQSNKEILLKNNDKVTLANSSYQFMMPELSK
ncbi:MAG: FHA domain-containing protein [Clostridia bacterium]|nr:FHA domain-containing protein [Clostridia bacterium]